MKTFAQNLNALPLLEELLVLRLQDAQGVTKGLIENKPGSAGSFRVYYFVANKWGGMGPDAAREALVLFAEHSQDAKQHPGKHPNIDRLFEIVDQNLHYTVQAS